MNHQDQVCPKAFRAKKYKKNMFIHLKTKFKKVKGKVACLFIPLSFLVSLKLASGFFIKFYFNAGNSNIQSYISFSCTI